MNCLGYEGVLLVAASPFPTPSHFIELPVIHVFSSSAAQVSFLLHVHSLFNGYFFLLFLDIELLGLLLCL